MGKLLKSCPFKTEASTEFLGKLLKSCPFKTEASTEFLGKLLKSCSFKTEASTEFLGKLLKSCPFKTEASGEFLGKLLKSCPFKTADYVPLLIKLGRASRRRPKEDDPRPRSSPASFNLRSLTRSFGSFSKAVAVLRARAATGSSGNCTPSICDNGDVMAGETRNCWKIGTVHSTNEEVTKNILAMGECNRCGLETGLSQEHKRAIGLSTLFLPNAH